MLVKYDKNNGFTHPLKDAVDSLFNKNTPSVFDNYKNEKWFGSLFDDSNGTNNFTKYTKKELANFLTGFDNIDESTGKAIIKLKEANMQISNVGDALKVTNGSLTSNYAKVKLSEMGYKALGFTVQTVGSILSTMAISFAVNIAVTAISSLINASENLRKEAEESRETYKNLQNSIKSSSEFLNSADVKEFEELHKSISRNGTNLGLTNDEFERYKNLANEVAKQFPDLVSGYDSEGNAIIRFTDSVSTLSDAFKELKKQQYDDFSLSGFWGKGEGSGLLKESNKKFNNYKMKKENLNEQYQIDNILDFKNEEEFIKSYNNGNFKLADTVNTLGYKVEFDKNGFLTGIEDFATFQKDVEELYVKLMGDTLDDADKALFDKVQLLNAHLQDSEGENFEYLSKQYQDLAISAVQNLSIDEAALLDNKTKLNNYADDIIKAFSDKEIISFFDEAFKMKEDGKSDEEISKYIDDNMKDLENELQNYPNLKWDKGKIELILGISTDDNSNINVANIFEQKEYKVENPFNTEDIKQSIENIKTLSSAFTTLSGAIVEFNSSGKLSLSTLEGLIDSGVDFTKYINAETGALELNDEALTSLIEQEKENLRIKVLQKELDLVKSIKDEAAANAYLTDSVKSLNETNGDYLDFAMTEAVNHIKSEIENNQGTNYADVLQKILDDNVIGNRMNLANDFVKSVDISEETTNEIIKQGNERLTNISSNISKAKKELEQYGSLGKDTVESMRGLSPELDSIINTYDGSKSSSKKIIEELQTQYGKDYKSYSDLVKNKHKISGEYYKNMLSNQQDLVKKFGETYKIDLESYANMEAAKLAINNKYDRQNAVNLIKQKFENWQSENPSLASNTNNATYKAWMNRIQQAQNWAKNNNPTYMEQKAMDDLMAIANAYEAQNPYDTTNPFGNGDYTYHLSNSDKQGSDKQGSDPTVFDWVETALDRIGRAVDKFKNKIDNLYDTWSTRQSNITNSLNKTKEQYNYQSAAYKTYMNKANSIGLSESVKQKIRNGSFSIDSVTDEKQIKAINQYKEWYEKAIEAQSGMEEAQKTLKEIERQKFELYNSEYNTKSDYHTKLKDNLKDNLSITSTNQDYDAVINKDKELLKLREQQYSILSREFNNINPDSNSELYYNLKTQLLEASDNAEAIRKELLEIQKIKFDNIKELSEFEISKIDHQLSLIDKEMSLIEAKGMFASSSFYEQQRKYYEDQKAETESSIKELTKIRDESGYKVGSSEYNSMTSEINSLTESVKDLDVSIQETINSAKELADKTANSLSTIFDSFIEEADFVNTVLEHQNELVKDGALTAEGEASVVMDLVKAESEFKKYKFWMNQAAELKKNGLVGEEDMNRYNEYMDNARSSLTNYLDVQEELKDLVQETLDAQLEGLQEIIDKKKEQMDLEKNIYDYQKNIRNQTKNIASLEKQIAAYQNDNSEEARARVQKLEEELKTAREELNETEYDKYMSDTQDMLDKLVEDYQEWMEDYLENSEELLQKIADGIDPNVVKDTIVDALGQYGSTMTDDLSSVFTETGITLEKAIINSTKAMIDAYGINKDDAKIAYEFLINGGGEGSPTAGTVKVKGKYAKGTKHVPTSGMYMTQEKGDEVIITKRGEVLMPLNAGDKVFNNAATNRLYDFMNNPHALTDRLKETIMLPQQNISNKNVVSTTNTTIENVSINLPNVKNYSEFMNELSKDNKFEKLIQSMTTGRLAGGSKMAKNAFAW